MKNTFIVDMHCHIDLYKNPAAVIREIEKNQIYTIAVTNAPFVFQHTAQLVAKCRYIKASAGLHPELISKYGTQLSMLKPLLQKTKYVGEVGLDYTTDDNELKKSQRIVFEQILDWCDEEGDKILTVHSRRAGADVISMIGKSLQGKAILHWFSGSIKEVEKASAYGMYFSVNPAMTKSAKGKSLISAMPRDRVLTESDGPFVKVNGQVCKPTHLDLVITELSQIWGLSYEGTKKQICENFRCILKAKI